MTHFSERELKFLTNNPEDQHAQKKITKHAMLEMDQISNIYVLYGHIYCFLSFLDTRTFQLYVSTEVALSMWVAERIRKVVAASFLAYPAGDTFVAACFLCIHAALLMLTLHTWRKHWQC